MTLTWQLDQPLPARVQNYLDALVQLCTQGGWRVVSVVLFGSAAKGGFASGVSDVDSIIVLEDGATPGDKARLADAVECLEISHGLRPPARAGKRMLEAFADRAGGNAVSSFVCTRS